MKCVFLDRESLDAGDLDLSGLEQVGDPWVSWDKTAPEQVAERIRDAEIVISNKVALDLKVLEQAESLKLICVAATGTNNIDLAAARDLGIPVCNARAYATPSVVEHVFALILSLTRKLAHYHSVSMDGHWIASEQFCVMDSPVSELQGKVIGIVGYGELGRAVGRVAECFGLEVRIAQRPGTAEAVVGRFPLEELLGDVDILSLHCPLTDDTRNLIGKREFSRMKPTALLINTARGGIVDEAALAEALQSGKLGGAGIDVLHEEPPRHGNILLDADIPNLIVTPHMAWSSREARQRLVNEMALNIDAYKKGEIRNEVV